MSDEFDTSDCDIPTLDISVEDMMKQHVTATLPPVVKHSVGDTLSTHRLVSILYDVDPEYVDSMVGMVGKYDMVVSSKLNGWKGIDSKLCVKLIHLTCEWNSDRVRLLDRVDPVAVRGKIKPRLSKVDEVFLSYYEAIWFQYSSCFDRNVCYILTVEKQLSR